MIAVVRIRDKPPYRRDSFIAGLRSVGYDIQNRAHPKSKHDLLVIWNRYGPHEIEADRWEKDGGTVIVTENGYCGKDAQGRPMYAISVGQHNGAGWYPVGDEDRFSDLGIELKPWRTDGEHILVCGQRGVGSKLMASPAGWHLVMAKQLARMTERPIKVRAHPGPKPATVPLEHDLRNAWACVIWSSGCGVTALAEGIPVFYDAPSWVCGHSARRFSGGVVDIEAPLLDDEIRNASFRRLSYAQWSVSEIAVGTPFKRIQETLDAA